MNPGNYLLLAAALFAIGTVGVLLRRNAIVVFMSIELMLNAANLTLVTFSRMKGTLDGQMTASADNDIIITWDLTYEDGLTGDDLLGLVANGSVVVAESNCEGVVKLGMLQPGKYRELTKAEVNGLRAAAAKGRAQTRSAALQSKAAARRPRGPVGGNKAATGKKHK